MEKIQKAYHTYIRKNLENTEKAGGITPPPRPPTPKTEPLLIFDILLSGLLARSGRVTSGGGQYTLGCDHSSNPSSSTSP